MLPDFLRSDYKTYKADTDAIATWLALTAKRCGYAPDLLESGGDNPTATSKRLKGKARKQTKEAKEAKQTKQAKLTGNFFPIKHFAVLANFIATCKKPVVEVPINLVSTLRRAIRLRKEQGQWAKAVDASTTKTNAEDTHAFFLGVLEEVEKILKPCMPSSTSSDPLAQSLANVAIDEDPQPPNAAQQKNKFADIEVEEPSQQFLDAPDAKPIEHPNFEPKYVVEPIKGLQEEYMASHYLFQDIRRIRALCKGLWTNYLQGMDIIAVSITINTAINFVRSLEQDFVRQFPSKTDYEDIVRLFYGAQSHHQGHDPSHRQRPGDVINFKLYELSEEIMLPTASSLSSLQDILSPGEVPLYKTGFFGYRDRTKKWSEMTPREKHKDDQLILFEAFPDLVLMSMVTSKLPLAEDELIRGIRDMAPGRDIPLWLVFAVQCFLDAQHILGTQLDRAHSELLRTSSAMKESVKQNLDFQKALRIVNWPRQNDLQFTEQVRVIDDWIFKDIIAEKLGKTKAFALEPALATFRLMKQYPLLCGLFAYALKMRAQEVGLAFTNAWGSVMYASHLYNAVRQEKLLPKVWKDMGLAISLQSTETLFVGNPPKKPEEYLKRFELSMGRSTAAFAKDRRPNASTLSSRGPRCMKKLCPVAELFAGRYCNNDRAVSWTSETMKQIIEAKMFDDDDQTEDEASKMEMTTSKVTDASKSKRKKSKVKTARSGSLLKRPKREAGSIPTNDFLSDLANSLHAECLEMSMDYLLLHRICWHLLRQINDACKPKLLEIYGGGYLEEEHQLPFVVGYIFMAATLTMTNVLIPRRAGVHISTGLLASAANVIDNMIDCGEGDVEVQRLQSLEGDKYNRRSV